ncbi:unnamed protein product [Alternaria alternata]
MQSLIPRSGADRGLGHSNSISYPKTRVRATRSGNPSHGGSGVQKRGKTSMQNQTLKSTCPLDITVDHLNAPRKAKRVQSKYVGGGSGDESRVVCPFHKYDPKTYRMSSCKGKGFNELAKMKDHFKQIHGSSQEVHDADLNFKKKEYSSLDTIGAKWRLVYKRLFPYVASIPSPYANEQEDSDAFLHRVAKRVVSIRNDYSLEELIIKIARDLKENRSERSASIDSAVGFELEDLRVTKVDEPITPPPGPYEGSSLIIVDEAYKNDSYFDLSHEHIPQSGSDTVTVSAPFASQGNALHDLNNDLYAISSHQTNDDFVYHGSTIAPMAHNLSKESLEMPPATCPSLEEQSQVWSPITNEYLNGLNEGFGTEDWVQTSMLGEEVGSYQDQEVFTGA